MLLAIAATLSTVHIEGDATAGSGDYIDVPFTVPAGTVEFEIAHVNQNTDDILDFGVWQPGQGETPDGVFRGWSGGLTDDLIIGVAQSSRGYLPGAITPGSWTLVIGKAQLTTPAHYVIDITFRDAATIPVLPQAAWTPVVMSSEQRWYKGDFHVHDSESGDASATLPEDSALAKTNGLDFANFSDHNTVSQQALIAAQQSTWPILALRGSEITTYSGHGNGVGISQYVDHRLGYDHRDVTGLIGDVTAQGGIFIINHAATDIGSLCIGCKWAHEADTPWDQVSGIEVLTGNYDLAVTLFTPTVLALWDRQEAAGHRIAAVGGSDDHRAGINEGSTASEVGQPCTHVLADELSEAGIIAGVKARHTFVQLSGCNQASITATIADKNGSAAQIGDEVDGIDTVKITSEITGGSGGFAEVWRDGVQSGRQAITSDDFTYTYTDTPGAEQHRYRIELVDGGGKRTLITSHFYVQGVATMGSGCNAGGGGAAGLGGFGVLAAVGAIGRVRRRRRK